jgi:hypothetical protein
VCYFFRIPMASDHSPGHPARKACGAHVELVRNATTRITRCGCGQMHVTFLRNGVSVQLSAEHFRELAVGVAEADAEAGGDREGLPFGARVN